MRETLGGARMKMAVRAEASVTGCIVGNSRQPPCQQHSPFLSTVWQWGYISSPENPSRPRNTAQQE